MWKATVEEYNRYAGDCFDYSECFSDKQEAIEYCNSLKDSNCGIWLEELTEVGDDEYMDGNGATCIQQIKYE